MRCDSLHTPIMQQKSKEEPKQSWKLSSIKLKICLKMVKSFYKKIRAFLKKRNLNYLNKHVGQGRTWK